MPTGEYGVISFRVPQAEYAEIQSAAEAAGESMSAFVRKAIAQRLHGAGGGVPASYIATATRSLQQRISLSTTLMTSAPQAAIYVPQIP